MKAKLTIEMDNAAFGETDATRMAELARILAETAHRIAICRPAELKSSGMRIFDRNVNQVGKLRVTK